MLPVDDRLKVTNPQAVLALSRSTPRAILFALMQAEQSAGDLRVRLGLSPSLIHYHVAKLLKLGLIEIARRMPRAGRSIAIYRAASRSILVSGASGDSHAGLNARAQLEAAFDRYGTRLVDTLYCLGENDEPRVVRVPNEDVGRGCGEWWWRLGLSQAGADELAREIKEVVERHRTSSGGSGAAHLCYFAIAKP